MDTGLSTPLLFLFVMLSDFSNQSGLVAPWKKPAVTDAIGFIRPPGQNVRAPQGLTDRETALLEVVLQALSELTASQRRSILRGAPFLDDSVRRALDVFEQWYEKSLKRRIETRLMVILNENQISLTSGKWAEKTSDLLADELHPLLLSAFLGTSAAPSGRSPYFISIFAILLDSLRRRQPPTAVHKLISSSRSAATSTQGSRASTPSQSSTTSKKRKIIAAALASHPIDISNIGQDLKSFLEEQRRSIKTPLPSVDEEGLWKTFSVGGDMGVNGLSDKSEEQLAALLGLSTLRPFFFSPFRNSTDPKITSWSPDLSKDQKVKFRQGGPDMTPIKLQVHQAAALCAILHRAFCHPNPSACFRSCVNTLLGDGVGLGKTLVVMAFIAMLMTIRAAELLTDQLGAEVAGLAIPPFLAQGTLFAPTYITTQISLQEVERLTEVEVLYPLRLISLLFRTLFSLSGQASFSASFSAA